MAYDGIDYKVNALISRILTSFYNMAMTIFLLWVAFKVESRFVLESLFVFACISTALTTAVVITDKARNPNWLIYGAVFISGALLWLSDMINQERQYYFYIPLIGGFFGVLVSGFPEILRETWSIKKRLFKL